MAVPITNPHESIFLTKDDIVILNKLDGKKPNAYKARYLRTLDVFAKDVDVTDQSRFEHLKEEGKTYKIIQHPNVCTFMGVYFDQGRAYLVTELLEKDLSEVLLSKQPMTLYQKLKIAKDVCLGMAHLHNKNIVHNNLKLTNIVLDKNGVAKITDFGYAVQRSPDTPVPFIKYGGSLQYMAPERLFRLERQGTPSDVYSFGIILWELIMGNTNPYYKLLEDICLHYPEEQRIQQFKERIWNGERPPNVPDQNPMHQNLYSHVMARCWTFESNDRITFAALAEQLEYIFVEAAIPDPVGINMWLIHFVDRKVQGINANGRIDDTTTVHKEVPSKLFWRRFLETMGYDENDAQASTMAGYTSLFLGKPKEITRKTFFVEESTKSGESIVTLERFGKMVSLYGPLNMNKKINDSDAMVIDSNRNDMTMLEKMYHSVFMNYFHRQLRTETDAFNLLKHQKIGTFLLRLSGTTNQFSVSVVVPGQDRPENTKKDLPATAKAVSPVTKVVHYRVNHDLNRGYWFHEGKYYPSIKDLVEASKHIFEFPFPVELTRPKIPAEGNALSSKYEGSGPKQV